MAKVIKMYKQNVPEMRFIGKKHETPKSWCQWFENGWFEVIEKAAGGEDEVHKLYEDSDAYIGLMKCEKNKFDYWIGEFVKAGTEVPEGFVSIDFPASTLGVAWIYGKEDDTYAYEGEAYNQLDKEMKIIREEGSTGWCFERYACPRFTQPDEDNNVILDYCVFVKE